MSEMTHVMSVGGEETFGLFPLLSSLITTFFFNMSDGVWEVVDVFTHTRIFVQF